MIELLFIPFFAAMMFIRGFGRDSLPWYNPWNLFTSKGAVSLYVFITLAAYSGTVIWPAFTALMLLAGTFWYDKGELLSFLGSYSGGHQRDKSKIAYWITTEPLKRLPIAWEYKYGAAAALPCCLALAPWGMPLLPMLYGVIYKHISNDEAGRAILGACMGATFILGGA